MERRKNSRAKWEPIQLSIPPRLENWEQKRTGKRCKTSGYWKRRFESWKAKQAKR